LRIAVEESLADAKDIDTAKKDDRQENAEDDAQREDRVPVLVDNRDDRVPIHKSSSPAPGGMAG
jgi:hypothetical protein